MNFLTNTLSLDLPLSSDRIESNIDTRTVSQDVNSETSENLNTIVNVTSLDKIRVVIDSYIEGSNIDDLCSKERISKETFFKWRKDFLEGFNLYSEDFLQKKHRKNVCKELILKESSEEVYNFFKNYVDFNLSSNLILQKDQQLSTFTQFNTIKNVLVLKKINNFRLINKHLEEVNSKLNNGGLLLGVFETFTARASKRSLNNVPVVGSAVSAADFVFNRVCPKLPYVKKAYFSITKGKNRLLSKAEALGRLVSCGFEIVDHKDIDGLHYFVAKKTNVPAYDMNPSYGPLFKMQRIGKNGKMIGVYKFRTMHPYSEYLQDYVLKMNGYAENGKPAEDFRVVPWAKFLRRYWLDELPQLINVMKGELKLIGIRPVSKRFFSDIPEDIQKLRLTQKPGCIPPYVALNRKSSVEGVLQAEREYLIEKTNNPYFTDTKYFFKAIYNILIKRKRSA